MTDGGPTAAPPDKGIPAGDRVFGNADYLLVRLGGSGR